MMGTNYKLLSFKVVQEYERAVIFRLGRLLSGGSRGPGEFSRFFFESFTKTNFQIEINDIKQNFQEYCRLD